MTRFKSKMNSRAGKLSAIVVLFFMMTSLHAQTVLLHVDRATDSIPSKHGQNMPRYIYPFIKLGWVLGPDEKGARISYGNSIDFAFGIKKKYKVGSIYSFGWEAQLDYQVFKMVQDSGKIVPNPIQNKTERLDFSALRIGFFNRFNLDPDRGNTLGTFVDIGVSGEWNYTVRNIIKNDLLNGSKVSSAIKNQPYYTDLNAYGELRFGLGRLAFYGTYRFTDLFRPRFNFPELPRLIAGFELSLGN